MIVLKISAIKNKTNEINKVLKKRQKQMELE